MKIEKYGTIGIFDNLLLAVKRSFRTGYIPLNVTTGLKKELDKRGMLK